jgi:uncharacterized membrane protein
MHKLIRNRRHLWERGSSGLMMVALLPAIIGFTGLVVDGGRVLLARRRAQIAVDSAALAAASMVDINEFRSVRNVVQIDADEAQAAAQSYADFNYPGLGVSCAVAERQVSCSAAQDVSAVFMSTFGITSLSVRVYSEAELQYGITQVGQ